MYHDILRHDIGFIEDLEGYYADDISHIYNMGKTEAAIVIILCNKYGVNIRYRESSEEYADLISKYEKLLITK